MSLNYVRCRALIYESDRTLSRSRTEEDLADQLRDALSLLSDCRNLAYNLQNEHPALADLLDKLNEAGIE